MSHISSFRVAGWIVTSLLAVACGGKPRISITDGTSSVGGSNPVAEGGATST